MHLRILVPLAFAALLAAACHDSDTPGTGGGGGEAGSNQGGGPPDLPPTSTKALLKLKAGLRFRNDVAQALDLDDAYCTELGLVDCSAVHYLVMGGADALFSGVYQPLPETTATSPLAFERLAMSGCITRGDLDVIGGEGVIFTKVDSEDGRSKAIESLYHRALGRDPTTTETAALVALYGDVEAKGGEQPARDWAVLSCFAVLTTMENTFY